MLVLAVTAFGAFATLGDGNVKKSKSNKSLLSVKTSVKPGFFSLQSGYSFRGSQVINTEENKYINLNTLANLSARPYYLHYADEKESSVEWQDHFQS